MESCEKQEMHEVQLCPQGPLSSPREEERGPWERARDTLDLDFVTSYILKTIFTVTVIHDSIPFKFLANFIFRSKPCWPPSVINGRHSFRVYADVHSI